MTFTLLAMLACSAPGPVGAEYGSEIIVPGDVDYVLDAGLATPDDMAGMLSYGYITVLNPEGDPAPGIRVELISGWTGAYLIPDGAVRIVNDLDEACDSGAASDEACAAWYDTEGERYFEWSGEYEDGDNLRPNYVQAVTNNRGLVPFYVFVNSAPLSSEGDAQSFSIFASIGVDTDSFSFNPVGG
jgi:hypothetical protein